MSATTATSAVCGVPHPNHRHTRVRVGELWIDALTRDEALAEFEALVDAGAGGAVFTPNVNHVVIASYSEEFRTAYSRASLALADGTPLVWASRLLGARLPAKLSGSDMVVPLARLAAARGWGVYLLGGAPGSARRAADHLAASCGVAIVGIDEAMVSVQPDVEQDRRVLARLRAAQPDIVFVALGAPKQELWINRMLPVIAPAIAVGVGASLDFIAGRVRRAPPWVSSIGLEWAYRLTREPGRLWRRYLLHDPAVLWIVLRTLARGRDERVHMVPTIASRAFIGRCDGPTAALPTHGVAPGRAE